MLHLTINGQHQTLARSLSVAELLDQMGYDRLRIAVEVNREVIPRPLHASHRLAEGDAVEIVTLVGGGSQEKDRETNRQGDKETRRQGDRETRQERETAKLVAPEDKPLVIGKFRFQSRLITGTGKYASYELMR